MPRVPNWCPVTTNTPAHKYFATGTKAYPILIGTYYVIDIKMAINELRRAPARSPSLRATKHHVTVSETYGNYVPVSRYIYGVAVCVHFDWDLGMTIDTRHILRCFHGSGICTQLGFLESA